MNQCLRITFEVSLYENFLQEFIQKNARRLKLEGIVQVVEPKKVQIAICGDKDSLDEFVDAIYKGTAKAKIADIQVEPFLKERDYRGVFRIIE